MLAACLVLASVPALAQDPGSAPTVPDPEPTVPIPGPTVPPDGGEPSPPTPLPEEPPAPAPTPPPDPVVPDGGIRAPRPPDAPPVPTVMVDPTPHIRTLLAELEVLDRQARVGAERSALAAVEADLAAAEAAAVAAEAGVGDATSSLDSARAQLAELAVASFIYAYGGASADTVGLGLFDRLRGEQLTGSVVDHQLAVVRGERSKLVDAETAHRDHLQRVGDAAATVDAHRARLTAAEDELARAEADLRTARREQVVRIFDRADRAGWQLGILGDSAFTPDELAAWYAERGRGGQAAIPATELAGLYVTEGRLEGVRGDVAFAQAILETGWFRNDDTRRLNNYAGIGHCDSCPSGFAFDSPQQGVRAQIQHLKSYADGGATFANPLVDERLRGPAGCCRTWNELTGVYATNPVYGPLVLGIYERMLEWLVARRTLLPQVPPA